ncbi:MAG: HEPN domain-containing protein [Alkalinema sp. CAN_BIN05]|nr:HEPN domain-containing protein [Alkalinema sp. CAN_BIN05]
MSRIPQLLQLAQDELETAQLLLDNDRHRACISRAYYAMYHASQALLEVKSITSKTHKGTIQQFGLHFIKTGELPIEMARALTDGYDLRQLSDYEETIFLTRQQAEIVLNSAQEFVSQAQQYCSDTDRSSR